MTGKRELLDTSEGKGEIHDTNGRHIGTGDYELHLIREAHDDPSGREHDIDEIEGVITGVDALDRVGDPLVLTLADGRKLDFFFQDSDGTIVARAGFRKG